MASFKISDGMNNFLQPVQKRDPDLGPYEASGPLHRDSSVYEQAYPVVPGMELNNVKMEVAGVPDDVCRVCMTQASGGTMLQIFENTSLLDRVAWVLELPMFEGDGLPHNLCSDCRVRVDSAFELKTLAWHSDKVLRQANSQQPRDSSYLEDIAQVNLPGVQEDVTEADSRGPRILSCTSLSKSEEQLLLSGQLKRRVARSTDHVEVPNRYNHADFFTPPRRHRAQNRPAEKEADSEPPKKRVRRRKVLAVRIESPVIDMSLPGRVNAAAESPIINMSLRGRMNAAAESTDINTSMPGRVKAVPLGERKVEDTVKPSTNETEAIVVWSEPDKTTTPGANQSGIAETPGAGDLAETSARDTTNLRSCVEENHADRFTVKADEEGGQDHGDNVRSKLGAADIDTGGHSSEACKEKERGEEDCNDVKVPPTVFALPGSSEGRKRGRPRKVPNRQTSPIKKGSEDKVESPPTLKQGSENKVEGSEDKVESPPTLKQGSENKVAGSEDKVESPPTLKQGSENKVESPPTLKQGSENKVESPPTLKQGSENKVEGSEDKVENPPMLKEGSVDDVEGSATLKEGSESKRAARRPAKPPKLWPCADCEREFGLKKDLTAHLTSHGSRSVLKCAYCQAVFCALGRFNAHVRAHKNKPPPAKRDDQPPPSKKAWSCTDCMKEFSRRKDLMAHLTNHNSRSQMVCNFCCAVFCSLPRFNTHTRSHTGQAKLLTCALCPASFYRAGDLQTHWLVHGTEAHVCPQCGKTLATGATLHAHIKTDHTNEKLFKCHVCDKPFTFLGSMKDHIRLKHPQEYVHQCDSCNKTFNRAQDLQDHITTHVGVSQYTCPKCDKKFSIKEVFTSHVKNHDRARSFVCETCGKSFLDSSTFRCHQRTHSGDRPFKCHLCDKAYSHPSTLRTHVIGHTAQRCHSCNICGKSFRAREALKRHMVAHSNLREFKCGVCGLEFLHKNNLDRHLNNMHGRLKDTI